MARIIDTSLWVDFTRAKSPPALRMKIHPWILDKEAHLCEPVAFETLRLARPDERSKIQAQFSLIPLLSTPSSIWRDAIALGQELRDQGVTPGAMDLLIARIAMAHDAEVVTFDTNFVDISRASSLKVKCLTRE